MKYVPAWFPGAGFKRKAEAWRKLSQSMLNDPYQMTKRKIVRQLYIFVSDHGPSISFSWRALHVPPWWPTLLNNTLHNMGALTAKRTSQPVLRSHTRVCHISHITSFAMLNLSIFILGGTDTVSCSSLSLYKNYWSDLFLARRQYPPSPLSCWHLYYIQRCRHVDRRSSIV